MISQLFNQKGEEIGQARLAKEIFGLEINTDLVHQVVVSQMSSQRQKIAQTKDRGEVRGGGIKPWRQKGTGRARVGSIRSPLWIGGGVTFGPRKEKVFKKGISKKMKRKALLMVLSSKLKNSLVVLLDKLEIERGKTKELIKILNNLPCKGQGTLVVLSCYDKKIILASRNIPRIKTIQVKELNALDMASSRYLLITKDCLKLIKEIFSR